MGASRVILHPGSKGKFDRHDAVNLALDTFKKAIVALDDEGLGHITLCPETMGKINQLGDLDEIMEFCKIDERVIPCIDFGHLNSRTHGGLKTKDDFGKVLDTIEKTIGNERMKKFHAHFSKIEWSEGGEVKHLTFEDTVFGPDFRFLAEIIAERKCSPTIICESAGTQAEDALTMKKMYLSAVEGCAR